MLVSSLALNLEHLNGLSGPLNQILGGFDANGSHDGCCLVPTAKPDS